MKHKRNENSYQKSSDYQNEIIIENSTVKQVH